VGCEIHITVTMKMSCYGLTDHPVPGGYKYVELAPQVGGVSDETIIYDYGSCATLTST
jgi:hypothetical protein